MYLSELEKGSGTEACLTRSTKNATYFKLL